MNDLKISAAMCTYRGEKYLQEQLDSIARQTRLPDELVICDDNSTDSTTDIINDFSASSSFPVRFYKNAANIGSTKNFEQAITHCDGDIIVLSDQDDVWHNNKLDILEKFFISSPETGAAFSNANIVSEDMSPLDYTLWDTFFFNQKSRNKFNNGKEFELLLNHNVVTGATMAFRSWFRDKILPIPTEWVHDGWIAILISIVSRIACIDEPLIEYRQHDKQQLGGLKPDFAGKKTLAKSVDNYQAQIKQYELLAAHVQRLGTAGSDFPLSNILEKISHLKVRTAIYGSSGFARLLKAAPELLAGRYHKYSHGYLSICKDLFLVNKRAHIGELPD